MQIRLRRLNIDDIGDTGPMYVKADGAVNGYENVKVYAADDHGLSIKTKENRHIFVSTPFGSPS